MRLQITDVQPKVDQSGVVKKTAKGDVKYKVSVAGSTQNFTAYGDWVKDYVGKETDFETKDEEYMGNAFTIIWEPKLGKVDVHAERAKEFDQVAKPEPEAEKWDRIARGKVLSNIVTSYVANTGDLEPSDDVWEAMKVLRDRVMAG